MSDNFRPVRRRQRFLTSCFQEWLYCPLSSARIRHHKFSKKKIRVGRGEEWLVKKITRGVLQRQGEERRGEERRGEERRGEERRREEKRGEERRAYDTRVSVKIQVFRSCSERAIKNGRLEALGAFF